ncbi:YfhO family protein [Yinghuangia aomiensis]
MARTTVPPPRSTEEEQRWLGPPTSKTFGNPFRQRKPRAAPRGAAATCRSPAARRGADLRRLLPGRRAAAPRRSATGRARSSDLANQFVPFHAHFWDLLRGDSSSDFLFNWNGAFGTTYFPDFYTYMGNPFSWTVAFLPRSQIDLAVFLVTPLSMAFGAAVMAKYLRTLAPGPWWMRSLLGFSYGLCAWALDDAAPDPMWLWGLAAFPLICFAAEWSLQGRRWVLGSLFVALAWFGNFYTAIMATIGARRGVPRAAGVRLPPVARAAARAGAVRVHGGRRRRARPGLRAAVVPGQQGRAADAGFDVLGGVRRRLSDAVAARHAAVGDRAEVLRRDRLALLLVLSFPLNRRFSGRVRAAWSAALVLVALSFVWEPTVLLWHGAAVPNGSPYRATFILGGLIVMVAWISLSKLPGKLPAAVAAAVVVALLLFARTVSDVQIGYTKWALLIGTICFAVLILGLRFLGELAPGGTARWVSGGIAVLLIAGVTAEGTLSAVAVDDYRNRLSFFTPKPEWGKNQQARYDAVRKVDGWPNYRTDSGLGGATDNDSSLFGAQGPEYYSSYYPERTAKMLQGFGFLVLDERAFHRQPAKPRRGRHFLHRAPRDAGSERRAEPRSPAPRRRRSSPCTATPGRGRRTTPSTARTRRSSTACTRSPCRRSPGARTAKSVSGDKTLRVVPDGKKTVLQVAAQCTPGTTAYFFAPNLPAELSGLGDPVKIGGRPPMTKAPMTRLGVVPQDGRVKLAVKPAQTGAICLLSRSAASTSPRWSRPLPS